MRWHEAEVIMADLKGHRHTIRGTCVHEIGARMRLLYPTASTVLARPEDGEEPDPCSPSAGAHSDYLLLAAFRYGQSR